MHSPAARHPLARLPWYREPWAWGLMLAPAAAVVWGGFMLWLAIVYQDPLIAMDHGAAAVRSGGGVATGSRSAPSVLPDRRSGSPDR